MDIQTNLNESEQDAMIQQEKETLEAVTETIQEDAEEPLTPEQLIEKWKAVYNHIYLSVYDDQEFVWHKINRQEYAQIMDSIDETDKPIDQVVEQRQTLTLEYALLSPDKKYLPEILQEYPGILTSLTAEILKKSGFSKPLTVEI